jgi:hypothetical protein
VTINRRNPALQDNRRACPRRDTERRKFQRNKIQQVAQTTLRNNLGSSVFPDIYNTVQEGRGQPAHQVGYSKRGWQLGHRSDGRLDPAGDNNPAGARSSDVDAGAGRQAEREKSARVTYGESEVLVAKQFEEASKVCTLTTPGGLLTQAVEHAVYMSR